MANNDKLLKTHRISLLLACILNVAITNNKITSKSLLNPLPALE